MRIATQAPVQPAPNTAAKDTLETVREVLDFSVSAIEALDPGAKQTLEGVRGFLDNTLKALETGFDPAPAPTPKSTSKPTPKPASTPAPKPAPKPAHKPARKPHTTTLTVATVNDDFVSPRSNLPHVKADVVLAQEAKNENVRKLEPKAFGVHQNTARQDKAGTAVVWNKKKLHAEDKGYALGVRHGHHKMLDRWINYSDLKVDGRTVRMISVHRPPQRYKDLWPQFDRNVAAFVKQTKKAGLPMVIGMDSNERNGPHALAKMTGLTWHGVKGSIDGFLVSPGIHVEHLRTLPKDTSDHHPVVATIRFRTPGK